MELNVELETMKFLPENFTITIFLTGTGISKRKAIKIALNLNKSKL